MAEKYNQSNLNEIDQILVEPPAFNINEPNPDDDIMKWAEKNIDENPNLKLQLIEELRDMIFEKGECEPERIDDAYLLRFLRARHFIVRMAHRLIVNHCNFKESYPEFFTDLNYDKLCEIGDSEIFSIPPYVDQDGRRMLIVRFGKWNPAKISTNELFQSIIMMLHMAVLEPSFQILGGICIIDAADISTGQAWYLTPTIVNHILAVAYGAFPHRIQALHIVNASRIFDYALGMIRPFLSDVMKERMFFHSDMESLHQHIDPKYLPKRYGGVHKDYFYNDWLAAIKKCDHLLDELESSGYEGSKKFIQSM
ncbi:alpha-tocopherol transfer protein-like [Rhynchophorus ferrugineus]|uniref:alpha-tocopherol transfer protein-like n=1 Tax=Rhynchophorus ferrugineus TaxID=354439 RepID=UPI003FCD5A9A